MEKFLIYNIVEYRSDDPTWIMWRVNHKGKDYLMAYSHGNLKEVYFVGERIPNYFMSCRADDLSKISHYYVDRRFSVIRRYENGVRNRLYCDNGCGVTECETHKYVQRYITTEQPDVERLHNDLVKFLDDVSKAGIKIEKPPYVV